MLRKLGMRALKVIRLVILPTLFDLRGRRGAGTSLHVRLQSPFLVGKRPAAVVVMVPLRDPRR